MGLGAVSAVPVSNACAVAAERRTRQLGEREACRAVDRHTHDLCLWDDRRIGRGRCTGFRRVEGFVSHVADETRNGLRAGTAIRRRILTAFESAEAAQDHEARRRLLTFVVIGGRPTGVEMSGTIAELARVALRHAFRNIDSREAPHRAGGGRCAPAAGLSGGAQPGGAPVARARTCPLDVLSGRARFRHRDFGSLAAVARPSPILAG